MSISSLPLYEVMNMLLPGVTSLAYVMWLCEINVSESNLGESVVFIFVAYLVGLIVSRVGSLVVESLFRKIKIIAFCKGYYNAEKKDDKLPILLREMNCYRTLTAEGLILVAGSVLACATGYATWLRAIKSAIFIMLAMVIFAASYIKQSKAICNRINKKRK